jgi:hypothetical protein
MKRKLLYLGLFAIFASLTFPLLIILYEHYAEEIQFSQINIPRVSSHILGGFSVDTLDRAAKASTDGIQVVFNYGQPPTESSELGQKLRSLHMKVVDGFISSDLFYYECHRTKTVKPPPPGEGPYCKEDSYPYLSNESALLASITNHLKQVKGNQLIIGYWVLDDWVPWDAGSAQQLLIKIHRLIQQYTPGRPATCGFGAGISLGSTTDWQDWLADNFSPQGCDMVGFYIYAPAFPIANPGPSSDAFDWSMSSTLTAMFASLQRRGWDITKEPLVGIGQAFGGPIAQTDYYRVTPTEIDIETQSKSFCEHGATGLTFYGWDDSGFAPTTLTPMNSAEIESGIRNGIAACKQYWSRQN